MSGAPVGDTWISPDCPDCHDGYDVLDWSGHVIRHEDPAVCPKHTTAGGKPE